MKTKQFKVDGITYTVRATTEKGIKDAIRMMKNSIKKNKEEKDGSI